MGVNFPKLLAIACFLLQPASHSTEIIVVHFHLKFKQQNLTTGKGFEETCHQRYVNGQYAHGKVIYIISH